MQTNYFPASLKHARVQPKLKKPSMDPNVCRSYRSISSLSYIYKLNERVVVSRFTMNTECHIPEQIVVNDDVVGLDWWVSLLKVNPDGINAWGRLCSWKRVLRYDDKGWDKTTMSCLSCNYIYG